MIVFEILTSFCFLIAVCKGLGIEAAESDIFQG